MPREPLLFFSPLQARFRPRLRVQRSNIHCSLHSPKKTRKMRRGWSCFQLRIAREGLGPTYTELEHASLGKPPTINTCVAPLPSIITTQTPNTHTSMAAPRPAQRTRENHSVVGVGGFPYPPNLAKYHYDYHPA